jgi:hypothetical protein
MEHKINSFFRRAKEGSLRLYCIINVPSEPTYYPVNDEGHALRLMKELAQSQLLYPDEIIMTNMFGLEIFKDGEWEEWASEDGESIEDLDNNTP